MSILSSTLYTFFTSLALVASVAFYSSSVVATPMQTIPGKSASDTNEYATLTLENGLTVILVSDPSAERSAAALAVNAGNFQDPDQHPGIAHLLEHMLFLGTEKYPEADAYQHFIRAHGGSHNAYTSGQLTNYYFDVLPANFPEALDRFAQFFIAPTLDSQYIAREINAVDAEYRAKLGDETRRSLESLKQLYNDQHPASRFTVGNLDTLGTLKTPQLKDKLEDFFKRYYTPDNMVLTLVSNQSLATLSAMTRQYFSALPATHTISPPPLPSLIKAPGKLQFFKTHTEKNLVKFLFPIASQATEYSRQPTRYVAYLLGDESADSLFADLKQHHWAQSLHVGVSQDDGQHALLSVTIQLTDEGVRHSNQVSARLFKAIENIRRAPIDERLLNEIHTLSQLNYRFHDYIAPQRMAQILSARALDVPAMALLNSFHITQNASEKQIHQILKQLKKDNVLIQWQSPEVFPEHWAKTLTDWKTEPLYQGQYRTMTLADDWPFMSQAAQLSTQYGLPSANPFMPETLTLQAQTDPQPYLLDETTSFDFWFRANSRYNQPRGMIFGYFGLLEQPSHRDSMMIQLWTRLFNDAMSETTYQPYMAGLGYKLYSHRNGLTLRTNGYNDKQGEFFLQMIDRLMTFRASPERLNIARQEVSKQLRNLASQPPYALARHYFSQVTIQGNSSIDTMQQQLNSITTEDINAFIETHLQRFHYTGYMTGNFLEHEAQALKHSVKTRLAPHLGHHTYQYVQLNSFEPSKRYLYPFDTSSTDSTVLYSLIATDTNDASYLERAYIRILTQLLSSRFYNEFRTEKQYGYIVAVTNQTIEKTPAIGFLVQSPTLNTQRLVDEIERFIEEQKWDDNVTQSEFQHAKTALLATFTQPPKNLREEALREWPNIVAPEHNFDERQDWIDAIEQLDREAFLGYVNKKIEQDQVARLLITNKWQDLTIWQSIAIH